MALPSSGSILLSQVNTELGRSSTATISLGESAVRTLFGVSSGAISMSNGYGKANQFAFTISSNQTNANLATLATTAGWNGTSKVVATIGSGVYISSNSTGTPALTISGSFPGGVELINNGYIVGMGGAGGNGGTITSSGKPVANAGAGGSNGGIALSVSTPVSINNTGIIGGGGGGGGGGGSAWAVYSNQYGSTWVLSGGSGGGGGRTGTVNSSGGSGGIVYYGVSSFKANGNAGGSGTSASAGSGGASATAGSMGGYGLASYGGAGGNAGSWGTSGSSGSAGSWASTSPQYTQSGTASGASGGSAGGAVTGNSNITWIATGTRYGSIS